MRSSVRTLAVALVAVLLPACSGPEPIGPTPVDQGIIIFIHAGFRGPSQQLGTDISDLTRVEGPCGNHEDGTPTWNDCISSVRVLPGWGATLYGDRNFRGATIELTEDVTDLALKAGSCSGSYDDCISSIRVYRR